MAQSFIACDREQAFLMPPDVREWLAEGHLAWFVIDAVTAIGNDGLNWPHCDGLNWPHLRPIVA
jgi:hypothetical protein